MRKVAVAACLLVAFFAVGLLGMQLAGGAEAEAGGVAAPLPAAKVAAPAAPKQSKTWAERASASCERGLEDTRTLLDEMPLPTEPGGTDHEVLLKVVEATLVVEKRVARELDALPALRSDRRKVRRVVALLEQERRSGSVVVAALRVQWDDAFLDRELRKNARGAERLRPLFLELGATGCADYLQG